MPSDGGGFTIRGDEQQVRAALALEAALDRALNGGPDEPFEQVLDVNADAVQALSDEVAAREGPAAARQLLLREARRYRRWLRAVDLGLAGNDVSDVASQRTTLRVNLA